MYTYQSFFFATLVYMSTIITVQYTKQGIEQWIDMWKRKGWKTTAKTDVKNRDLWEAVDAAKTELEREQVNLILKWVKGHAGVPGNEAADRLAVRGIQGDW